jgi:3-dehydro-L-gulonate 2-dehydrogenase
VPEDVLHLPYDEIRARLEAILLREGMTGERAARCARLFADASRDGVPSHGLNRFGLMVKWMRAGTVVANAPLVNLSGDGALERWDGQFGPGPWNAWQCMARAVALAKQFGVGCVGLRRTNHWMRAGNYGWQAADAGCLGLCWTNTIALMPAWGGRGAGVGRRVGNNPLVLAVPRAGGRHLVFDMAMSQYSMGKLGLFRRAGEPAPLPAGFDAAGQETRDPGAILADGAAMPIGAWKGAGLALLLDVMAAAVAGGSATHQVKAEENERGVSQVFIAIDAAALGGPAAVDGIAAGVLADLKTSGPDVLYPGERSFRARQDSLTRGVPVDRAVWEAIVALDRDS